MMAAAKGNRPQNVAFAGQSAACLRAWLREYKEAEASAAEAIAISEKHQILYFAALSRCILGHAKAQLGNETEGIDLIRQGIISLFEVGSRLGVSSHTLYLAEAQERMVPQLMRLKRLSGRSRRIPTNSQIGLKY
jgi:hypothetical protein